MNSCEYHVGERLSLKGQACTVQSIGPVADKPGFWLGVEWDDPNRGKHDGTFEGVKYFSCRSKTAKAASFLKPTQPWDAPRTFLTALREKYMPEFRKDATEIVYISGKQAEEVGFEKFSQRQSRLQGIHVLVLDHMRINYDSARPENDVEKGVIRDICIDITELDLSGNLFETFHDILEICALLPKLRVLTLDGNRFRPKDTREGARYDTIPTVKSLSLSRTLLEPAELDTILSFFPNLETLFLAENETSATLHLRLPSTLTTLDLSGNQLSSLRQLRAFTNPCPKTMILKRNNIRTVDTQPDPSFTASVTELDLTYNAIDDWAFFNAITTKAFPNLSHIRVTGNPLYTNLVSASGKTLTSEDGYMLTIARVPQLQYLNYAKITDKERLNAETYYLGQIAQEIARTQDEKAEAQVIAKHPRYRELCEEYGEPNIPRQAQMQDIHPNSLAAGLVVITFVLGTGVLLPIQPRSWTMEVPKSFNIYTLLGMVGKRIGVMPLDTRLILETNERDPVDRNDGPGEPEWWDSSDDDEPAAEDAEWVKREVELIAGTRSVGTYIDGREAIVRIEMKKSTG